MMPTKSKSSTAAKSKRKATASRGTRTASPAKSKSSASKKASGSGSRTTKHPAAAKARPVAKPAHKPIAARPSARPAASATPAARAKPAAASHGHERHAAPGGSANQSNVRQLKRQVAGIAPYEEQQGEAYMGEPQREHFRRILLEWKRELMAEVDRTVHHMQDEAANFPDPNDRATQESEFSLELRARDRERKLIKKIDEALASVSSGDYGYCESCGVEIGIRRLEARPTATLCIDCKTLDEIREKQTGS
jgi:DnaK suppressor protein